MFVRWSSVSICLFISAGACVASGPTRLPAAPHLSADLFEVLGNIRHAAGFEALKTCTMGIGVEGAVTSILDPDYKESYGLRFTPDGRYRTTSQNPWGSVSGYDGNRQWFMDYSGMPWCSDESSRLLAYWVMTGTWLARLDDLSLAVVCEQTSEDRVILSIRIKKGGAKRWLVIDRQTWLPKMICLPRQLESPEWEFESYRSVLGLRLPCEIVSYPGENESTSQAGYTIKIDQIRRLDRPGRDPYAMPEPSRRVKFTPAAPAGVECRFARKSQHVLVKASIDNKAPRWFLLDSGASSIIIDYNVADEMSLATVREFEGTVSEKPTEMRLARCRQLQIGPLTISKPVFLAMPIRQITQLLGDDVIGVIGYDVFRQAIVEMDAAIPSVHLYDPNLYDGMGLDWQPFRYSRSKLIHIRCRLEGDNEAYVTIDTGSNGGLSLRAEAFEVFGLKSNAKTSPWHTNFGGVTISHSPQTHLAWFEIGGHRFTDLEVGLNKHREQYVGVDNAGSVGLEILSQFKLVFDYPNMRMAFVSKKEKQPAKTEASADPQEPIHINDILQQWSAGREEEAVRSFLRLAQTQPSAASYRFFDCSEQQFVSLPEAERDQLREKMLAKFKVVRKFARELDRRAKEALAADDFPTAERLLINMKRLGAANTGPEVALLTGLVGKAIQTLADDGLTELDKARASLKRQ